MPTACCAFWSRPPPCPGLHLRLLEQPLPAALADDYRYLRPRSTVPLVADESVTDTADFAEIAQQFHGVNVKLMKAGGFRRGIELLRQTRAHGLLPMLGCMVETSVGIAAALRYQRPGRCARPRRLPHYEGRAVWAGSRTGRAAALAQYGSLGCRDY